MRDANVRGIDVPIDVEIADVAVALLAHVIREPADRQQIVRLEEREAVFGVQAFARQNLLRDRLEPRVGDLQSMSLSAHLRLTIPSPRFQGRITNAAAPQNSRNNKLI